MARSVSDLQKVKTGPGRGISVKTPSVASDRGGDYDAYTAMAEMQEDSQPSELPF